MFRYKRPFSLIEVLIALVLTIAILMTLMFFYRQVTEIGNEVDKTGQKNFNMRYIESRLAAILPKTISETDPKKDFIFFSIGDEGVTKAGSQSLIFTFDNSVSLDKMFSNHVLARLYLDKEGNFILSYWPSPKRWETEAMPPMKKEVLLQGIDTLTFEFYIPPKKEEKDNQDSLEKSENKKPQESSTEDKKKIEPEPKGAWSSKAWLQDYKQLPAMIKMILTLPKEKEPLVFIFPLANAKSHVIYE